MHANHDLPGISAPEVTDALQRVLTSETFARSERSRSFISYLVETEQAGNGINLKGFAIAVDVFGKSDDFDPASDSVVRVQAGRLRDLLETYYKTEGIQDPVRICVPRGTYVPIYKRWIAPPESVPDTAATATAESAKPASDGTTRRTGGRAARQRFLALEDNMRALWIAVLAMLVLVTLLTWSFLGNRGEPALEAENSPQTEPVIPSLAVPTVVLEIVDSENTGHVRRSVETVATAVSRFGGVALHSAEVGDSATQADFAFKMSSFTEDTLRLEVVNSADGAVVWAGRIMTGADAPRNVALEGVLTLLLAADGLLQAHAQETGTLSRLMTCMSYTQTFFGEQHTPFFQRAFDCHRGLIDEGYEHALGRADLASLMIEYLDDSYSVDYDITLNAALDEARRAVELGPQRASAYRALARALDYAGDNSASLDAMKQAYELNPYDLNIAAAWGYVLFSAGRFEEAVSVLGDSTFKTSRGLAWWHHTMFLAAMAVGDDQNVVRSTVGLARETVSNYVGAQLIAAQLAGDEARRDRLLARLGEYNTSYAMDPAAYYERRLPPEGAARAISLLRQAGYKW